MFAFLLRVRSVDCFIAILLLRQHLWSLFTSCQLQHLQTFQQEVHLDPFRTSKFSSLKQSIWGVLLWIPLRFWCWYRLKLELTMTFVLTLNASDFNTSMWPVMASHSAVGWDSPREAVGSITLIMLHSSAPWMVSFHKLGSPSSDFGEFLTRYVGKHGRNKEDFYI